MTRAGFRARPRGRRPAIVIVLAVLGLVFPALAGALVITADPEPGPILMVDRFSRRDGLITNAWAYNQQNTPGAQPHRVWEVTSGSLLTRQRAAWSGVPDGEAPDPRSSRSTGSAVLRARTRSAAFEDVEVLLRLRVDRLVWTERTPARNWDGVHVWLRYQSPQELYTASVARRDGSVVLKKKCAGGPSNGGTYHTLATASGQGLAPRTWSAVGASAETGDDGSVRLRLLRDGHTVLDVVDRGKGCRPIARAGAVGVRGDNAELVFDDFVVRALDD